MLNFPFSWWPRLISSFFLAVVFISCQNVVIDPSISSVEANDLTALVDGSDMQGCGTQLQSGLLFCRVSERQPTSSNIYFIGPKSNCDRAACVFIKIYYPSAEPALEVEIKKNEEHVAVSWAALTKQSSFSKINRGYWPFIRRTFYKDPDGNEHEHVDEGLIYLRVLSKQYESLHESKENPYYVWNSSWRGTQYKITTSGRTYVQKR